MRKTVLVAFALLFAACTQRTPPRDAGADASPDASPFCVSSGSCETNPRCCSGICCVGPPLDGGPTIWPSCMGAMPVGGHCF